ncbi:hypothetical protein E4V01_24270 [Methylorubrum sp. Q1]|uniref:VpaChn25_0724 family phage protein n=1 Tax=Methylorubrum sp. Q1 TaxID=2562453 RepID=UPI001076077B|nr:hypothetical protein [Methylorubrum sp. Q1]TFZ54919.1 hypothetical protein E4V01_24270 [Methylorubrum sp. Q1]
MISNEPQSIVAAIMAKHRALVVLRLLNDEEANGSINEAVLSDLLDTQALGCSRARLHACLRFLEQSALITTTLVGELVVAHVTREGNEVACGRVGAPGVQPFTPSCLY